MENNHLHKSLERYKAIVESVVDGIITIGTDGVIHSVNVNACKMFRYSSDELVGAKINILMPAKHSRGHDGYISNYLHSGQPKIIGKGREVTGLRSDGTTFPFWLSVSEIMVERERIFIGLIHDITEIKAAEKEVQELNSKLEVKVKKRTDQLAEVINKLLASNQRLEKENKERIAVEKKLQEKQTELKIALEKEKELGELKTRFVSNASHEFRTPLSTISSSASLALLNAQRSDLDRVEKHIEKIRKSVDHLTGILDDFMNLTRLEEQSLQINLEEISFLQVLQDVVDSQSNALSDFQKIIVNVNQEQFQNQLIKTDRLALRIILGNLLSNAIKYSQKTILVTAKLNESALTIVISDSGIGIPKEELQYLSTRFFRAKNVGAIEGTGLGLNIVYRYVNLLKGEIEIHTKENKGTKVIIQLPRI